MKINFHGAARTVTGSKHLLQLEDGIQILLDCGFFQGEGDENEKLNRHFGFDPAAVDILVLTHAHIDHSGAIPLLVKQGFQGRIYCTSATKDFCQIMLADTAKILENDAEYANKKEEKNIQPLYTFEDVTEALNLIEVIGYDEPYRIADKVLLTFTNAGHIPGAAAAHLAIEENGEIIKVTFTGDIGRYDDSLLCSPTTFPQCDYLICESTYGDRLHDAKEIAEAALFDIVHKTCIEKKGKVIIPAFSLGRTQEIVYALNELWNESKLPPVSVYVDSPLSTSATKVLKAHPECFNESLRASLISDPDPFGFDTLQYINRVEDSIALNKRTDPMIIISASGMAEAGRIRHHIHNAVEDDNNTILLVGYCTPNSLGGKLAAGEKSIKIFGKQHHVRAKVISLNSLSAHADYKEMLEYLSCLDSSKVKKVFLVHGEYETQVNWRTKLEAVGFTNIEIPEIHSEWELA